MEAKQRNSSFELLRIVAMLIIICHHFADHAGFVYAPDMINIPRLWFNFLWMGGKIGVNVFVMISGYFMVKSDGTFFPLRKALKFHSQLVFYGLFLMLVFLLLPWGGPGLFAAFLPLNYNSWWFATTYFFLLMLSPFVSVLLRSLPKNAYRNLLLLLTVVWCLPPGSVASPHLANDLLWFLYLFALSGYIRLWGMNPKITRRGWMWGFIAACAVTYLVITAVMLTRTSEVNAQIKANLEQQRIWVLAASLCLFMIFEKTDLPYKKWINTVASGTFGVYLIHDSWPVRNVLWNQILRISRFKTSLWMIPFSVVSVLLIFAVCIGIDLLRQRFVEKYWMKLIDRFLPKIEKPFRWIDKQFAKLFG